MSASLATLAARGLTVAAGPRLLLSDVDLVVAPGNRLGLLGPNGSGKSTLLQLLAGLQRPESGRVRLAPPSATVGYLPQEARPRPGESVRALLERRTGVAAASAELGAATRALAEADASTATRTEPAAQGSAADPGQRAAGTARANEAYAAALDRWLHLGGADLDARLGAVADELGLPTSLLDRPTHQLSGGQAARVQLAALLLARFDVFLLDEPTNDLDLDGLDRIERFVLALDAPLVVVSHDRAFLERTVTSVAEIDDHACTLSRYDGGWASYVAERARVRRHAEQHFQAYVDQRDTLVQRARTQRRWAAKGVRTARRSGEPDKNIRHRHIERAEGLAAQARRTDQALARLDVVEKPWEGWDLRLTIGDAGRSGDVVARLSNAVVRLGGGHGADHGEDERGEDERGGQSRRRDLGDGGSDCARDSSDDHALGERGARSEVFVLGPATLEIRWGERVAIVGANGSGKTTLLRALLGREPLAAGTRWMGPGVVVGEIGQGRAVFDGHVTLLEGFMAHAGVTAAEEARSVLAKFGLAADHVLRPPGSLSPGERTRATLAALQARGVNLLVLDEPTNHLDLPAIEQLEQALRTYGGTLILVTHDRRLLDTVGISRVVDVVEGRVTDRP